MTTEEKAEFEKILKTAAASANSAAKAGDAALKAAEAAELSANAAATLAGLNQLVNQNKPRKGKPLKDFLTDKFNASSKASEINRYLALAGYGMVWMFRDFANHKVNFDEKLNWALVFLTVALLSDFLQYAIASVRWHFFYHNHLQKGKKDDEIVESPKRFINFIFWLFIFKLAMMLCGYIEILRFLSLKVSIDL